MDLAVIAYAVAIAALAATAFALLFCAGRALATLLRRRPAFLTTVANEPGERLRRRWQLLGQQASLLLTSLLVFIIAAGALTFAEPPVPDALRVRWLQIGGIVVAGLGVAAVVARALHYALARRRLALRIDAAIAVAQSLARITANRNRVFHDVPTAFGVLDHVVAGLHGVYAVKVFARQPGKDNSLRLDENALHFGDGKRPVSLKQVRKIADRFSRECSKALKHDVHVRLVLAVPGWDIAAQTASDLLIANERNISMLTGWKDERDYLMNDDVDALQRYLDQRCARPG